MAWAPVGWSGRRGMDEQAVLINHRERAVLCGKVGVPRAFRIVLRNDGPHRHWLEASGAGRLTIEAPSSVAMRMVNGVSGAVLGRELAMP